MSDWEAETYRRFLMVLGGADGDEKERAQTLMREFLHFWPNAREIERDEPFADQRRMISGISAAVAAWEKR